MRRDSILLDSAHRLNQKILSPGPDNLGRLIARPPLGWIVASLGPDYLV